MARSRVVDWIQISSSLALVVGLVLVLYELHQARSLAEAQVINDSFNSLVAENLALAGENSADVFARACDAPESLSAADLRVMEALTWNRLMRVSKRYALYESQGFFGDAADTGWARFADGVFRSIFSTQFGRNWWQTTRVGWEPEIVALGDELLATLGAPNCRNWYESLAADPPTSG